jgi:hypothetical protein
LRRLFVEGAQEGPFWGPGGKEIPPTNKLVKMSLCTAMKIENKEIVEERLYFDVLGMIARQP